mgnify:CR=1 FL=1
MKKIKMIFILICTSIFLTACMTPEEIYEASRKYEATDEELKALSEGKLRLTYDETQYDSYLDYLKYLAAGMVSRGYESIAVYTVPLMVASFAGGLLLRGLAKRSMRLRRFATFVFMIGIPLFLFCLRYLAAFLADAVS